MAQRQRVGFQIQRLGVRMPGVIFTKMVHWAGFEPAPSCKRRLRPERSALDRSATST